MLIPGRDATRGRETITEIAARARQRYPDHDAFYANAYAAEPRFEDDDSAVFLLGDTLVNLLRARAVPELIEPASAAEAAVCA